MLIYDLKPNHNVSKRFTYHVFNKERARVERTVAETTVLATTMTKIGRHSRMLSMYGMQVSICAWNDMITAHPVAGLTYIVNFVPYRDKIGGFKEPTRAQYHWGGPNEKLGYMVTSSLDLELKVWNVRNDYSIVKVLNGHAKPISGLVPHPTFGLLVSASMDCTIRVWSLLTERGVCIGDAISC